MTHSTDVRPLILIAALSSTAACVAPLGADTEVEQTSPQAITIDNALTSNALTSNALTSNALTSNALTSNALTSNALTSNALTAEALRDPAARELLHYVTGCALSKGQRLEIEVDGETFRFDGAIGLARSWGKEKGSCDASCRGWVSGCVLARVDYLGEPVPISIRGDRRELASNRQERADYRHREGTYYGDIFAAEPRYYACVSPQAPLIPRVCGPSVEGCVMDVVGRCDDACDKVRGDGSFSNCRAKSNGRGHSGKMSTYRGSVTVFLK